MNLRRLTLVVLASIVILAPTTSAFATFSTVFIDTEFQGTTFNPHRWDTSISTNGVRWCASAGRWLNPSTTPCAPGTTTQAPPYGSIQQYSGEAHFQADSGVAGPYVWWKKRRYHSSPFPTSGDFELRAQVKFDTLAAGGFGFVAPDWADPTPSGANDPGSRTTAVFAVWGNEAGLNVCLLGTCVQPDHPFAAYHYVLDYENGRYSVVVSSRHIAPVQLFSGVASSRRPNTIWLGNPKFMPAGTVWSHLEMDRITVLTA
ncbi:MAG: hypothetical protein H0V07_07885 [Propionibacteriales bacterium]|nr:hypothetical protein [Propionibacteriales bacterium]MBA3690616.1 hypothetical protein [Actinomycetota bacterium]